MKIAVTGATGFIGVNLCNHLEKAGHKVVGIVRSTEKGKALLASTIQLVSGDLNDQDSLQRGFQGCDGVVHLAALFNNPENSWDDYRDTNVNAVERVILAAREAGVKRVVHCSTVGVAIGKGSPPYDETSSYNAPEWDKYETTKCEGEKLALSYARQPDGPQVVVIRPAQVYGPGDRNKAKFYKMVKKGVLINPGKTLKHLIYVDDLSAAFELAMIKKGIDGEIFTIAGDEITPLKDLILIVGQALGVAKPKIYLPSTPIVMVAAVVENVFNIIGKKPPIFRRSMDFFRKSVSFNPEKAKKVLDFSAKTSVTEGVQNTARWYSKEGLI